MTQLSYIYLPAATNVSLRLLVIITDGSLFAAIKNISEVYLLLFYTSKTLLCREKYCIFTPNLTTNCSYFADKEFTYKLYYTLLSNTK